MFMGSALRKARQIHIRDSDLPATLSLYFDVRLERAERFLVALLLAPDAVA